MSLYDNEDGMPHEPRKADLPHERLQRQCRTRPMLLRFPGSADCIIVTKSRPRATETTCPERKLFTNRRIPMSRVWLSPLQLGGDGKRKHSSNHSPPVKTASTAFQHPLQTAYFSFWRTGESFPQPRQGLTALAGTVTVAAIAQPF